MDGGGEEAETSYELRRASLIGGGGDFCRQNGLINTCSLGMDSMYFAPQYQGHVVVSVPPQQELSRWSGERGGGPPQLLNPSALVSHQAADPYLRPTRALLLCPESILRALGEAGVSHCCETTFIEGLGPDGCSCSSSAAATAAATTKEVLLLAKRKFLNFSGEDAKIHTLSYDIYDDNKFQGTPHSTFNLNSASSNIHPLSFVLQPLPFIPHSPSYMFHPCPSIIYPLSSILQPLSLFLPSILNVYPHSPPFILLSSLHPSLSPCILYSPPSVVQHPSSNLNCHLPASTFYSLSFILNISSILYSPPFSFHPPSFALHLPASTFHASSIFSIIFPPSLPPPPILHPLSLIFHSLLSANLCPPPLSEWFMFVLNFDVDLLHQSSELKARIFREYREEEEEEEEEWMFSREKLEWKLRSGNDERRS